MVTSFVCRQAVSAIINTQANVHTKLQISLPLGVLAFPAMSISASLMGKLKIKTCITMAFILMIPSTIMLAFADRKSHYWSLCFPALVIGTIGNCMLFIVTNVGIFKYTPPSMAGTVGALLNSSFQLGSALGLAVVTTIETSVESHHGGPSAFNGRAAAFWFVLGIVVVEFAAMIVFMRNDAPEIKAETEEGAVRRFLPA